MLYYYFYTLLVSVIYFINSKLGYYLILIGTLIFLVLLPSTGWDYDFYKESYDNAIFISKFPYFESVSSLTAEPLYVWYTSLVSVLTGLEFSGFLALNFLICTVIILYGLKNMGENTNIKYYLFLLLMPVIIPTIFYFSPRSSISFCFVFLGFFTIFVKKGFGLGIISLLIGFSLHTQYLLVSLYMIILYVFGLRSISYSKLSIILTNLIIAVNLFIFLFFIDFFEKLITTLFSFLPSATIAISKLHYISENDYSSDSFRLTSILSIFIYPMVLLFLIRKIDLDNIVDKLFLFGLVGIVFFGIVVNVVFIDNSHVAGRLSRFSDYFCMGFLLPYTLFLHKKYVIVKFISLVMCILSPVLFKSLYIGIF